MRFGIMLGFISLSFAVFASMLPLTWSLLLWWATAAFAYVALAYFHLGPGIFGKQSNGSLSFFGIIALTPFYLLNWGTWHLKRLLSAEPAYNEVAINIYVGRRADADEIPRATTVVVDLTAEFREPPEIVQTHDYMVFPTLDGMAPGDNADAAVLSLAERTEEVIYIHCGAGHGRSAAFAAALLIQRGLSQTAEEAVAKMQVSRPAVSLHKHQRNWVERFVGENPTRSGRSGTDTPSTT